MSCVNNAILFFIRFPQKITLVTRRERKKERNSIEIRNVFLFLPIACSTSLRSALKSHPLFRIAIPRVNFNRWQPFLFLNVETCLFHLAETICSRTPLLSFFSIYSYAAPSAVSKFGRILRIRFDLI